jgi:hypothetical protein
LGATWLKFWQSKVFRDTFSVVAVQDFGGIAVEDGNHEAEEVG